MHNQDFHRPFLYSPLNTASGNRPPLDKPYSDTSLAGLAGYVEELKKVNEELRQARRAALNLMEDAILSKEALRQSEEKYRTLFNTIDEGFSILEPVLDDKGEPSDFSIVETNPAWEQHIGAKNANGKPLLQVAPNFEKTLLDFYSQVALSGKAARIEYYTESVDRWYTSFVTRIGNEGSRQIAVVFTDITERKKAEETLRESKERLRILADVVPQVIWANDGEGKANYFNQRWYEYSGLSYEQSEGLGWQVIVHPDDAPASVKKWKQALAAGEPFDTEYRLRRYDGNYRWFIGRNVPLKNDEGKIISWFGTATDIEDLKKTEEALSQSEARLRITMESATDYAIIAMDTERRVERWSKGAEELFVYTEAEMIGESAEIIFTEEDRAAGMPQHEMEMARDTGRAADERWHQRKDGSRFYVSGVTQPIQNKVLTGYVKVMRDTTQEQLFTEELHRLVAERTIELRRSNHDLRQFAHVASHDLKEPIRKIQTFNNRILDEYADALPPKAKIYAEKIGISADRMVSMIEGVLRYSKLDSAKPDLEAVDLGAVLQDIVTDLEVMIEQKKAIVTATGLPTLPANPTLMYQLFYNLVLNSLKFSKEGEPSRINISAEKVKQNEEDVIRIRVSDNGIGFEQEFAEDIFKTFTRLHPAEDYEGTGLGLALCKKIVERHGGTISASGEVDKGATFTILLPVQNA